MLVPGSMLRPISDPSSKASAQTSGQEAATWNRVDDLNGDGFINVLDVALSRIDGPIRRGPHLAPRLHGGEVIVAEPATPVLVPGGEGSFFLLLKNNAIPVLGYSLDVRFVPLAGTVGTVAADLETTNFFDERNLFTAAGETRDPDFSIIQSAGTGGVFVNTISADNIPVLATDGVNDVLVQVFLAASADACGLFRIELGPATALSDSEAEAIPFMMLDARIAVHGAATCPIPAASVWGLVVLALTIACAGSVRIPIKSFEPRGLRDSTIASFMYGAVDGGRK